jgi:hypothetical protein
MSSEIPQSARASRAGIPEGQKQALRAWARSQESRPTHAASVDWFEQTYGRRLPQSSVSVILSSKYEYLDTGPATGAFRQQPPQWPILEERLFVWLKRARETGELSTGDAICDKAREIWPQITEYTNRNPPAFSHGWLAKFRKRFEAYQARGQQDGIVAAPPKNQRKELQALRTLCGEFNEENVYNVDETGLLWRKAPFDTLHCPPNELKRDRAHVCLMICTNATGSDRIPLWVIGHKEMPEALRGVNLKAMNCEWRHNRQAWVDVQIMSEWLTMFYEHVGSRRVILLLDNKHAHQAAVETTPPPGNVHVQLFPENTTDKHQPLRLGITQQLKYHYRKQWLGYMATTFQSGQNPAEMIGLYHTLCWITRNWRHDVVNATIYKAFRKTHLVEPQADYLTAPKLPDMTELYEKVIRYNQSGISAKSLEAWLNSSEEEFVGTMDETLRRTPHLDTSTLDESVNPLPPYELIPAAADAITGLQTAIRYMLNQSTTTANDILYLETMEKILDRKVRNEFLQQQNQTPTQAGPQPLTQTTASISALSSAPMSAQPSTHPFAQHSSASPAQPFAQSHSQPHRPPARTATQPHLPPGQQPSLFATSTAQPSMQTPTQHLGRPSFLQYQYPNQVSTQSSTSVSTQSQSPVTDLVPASRGSRVGIWLAGMAPNHIPSGSSPAASTPAPGTGPSIFQPRAPSEGGSYQPSEDEGSDDEMEM